MRRDLIVVKLLGYGLGIKYRKTNEDHNPKSENYSSDGSVKKFKFYKDFGEWNDWHLTIRYFYNYSLSLRIYLNR